VPRDDGPAEVYRITGARPSRSDDLDRRVNRYLISMGIRTCCVILVIVVPGPTRWIFAAGAVFLPYVAVLFANASGARPDGGPPPVDHHGLGAGGTPGLHPDGSPGHGTEGSAVLPGQVIDPTAGAPDDEG
jgi:Protein of unknown function (DUF3099)